jgi:hypothetical protein
MGPRQCALNGCIVGDLRAFQPPGGAQTGGTNTHPLYPEE